jgi:hypothetical protein
LKESTMAWKMSAAAFGLMSLLSACAQTPATPAGVPATVSGRCNAAPVQFAVGRQADAGLQEDTRAKAGARTVRVLGPHQVVTMEFNAERLNLVVDAINRVIRVNCG